VSALGPAAPAAVDAPAVTGTPAVLPLAALAPHPRNPRTGLGDLAEITALALYRALKQGGLADVGQADVPMGRLSGAPRMAGSGEEQSN
jgi:hypothetical protein